MKNARPPKEASALDKRRNDTTDDLFPGLLRAFLAEVITALPWLTLGFALGAVIEAAAAVWRAAQ